MKRTFGLASFLVSLALAGCGGGSGPLAPALHSVATMRVIWPARPRLIPVSANSLGVTVLKGGVTVGYALIARPTNGATETSTTFTDLPAGTLTVAVLAFPNADGTGVAQAAGGGTMTTAVDAPGSVTVSLTSTVASLTLTPTANRFGKGLTASVTASAHDSDGNVVLLSSGGVAETLAWTSSVPAVATITGSGSTVTANALAAGVTQIGASFVSNDTGDTITATPVGITVVATSGTVTIK